MAVRTYYGTCITEADESIKEVYVSDSDLAQGTFNFEEGDLLVVFFADTNTENEPSIVVYNKDTNQEVSTSDDSGKLIKSLDIEANMANAWAAGETVIFAYTQKSIDPGTYYWELIDGAHATTETYGDVKLDNTEDIELQWEPGTTPIETDDVLGTLGLNNGTNSIEITYPIQTLINEKFATIPVINYTGQLINNGNGGGVGHETETSEPFITRIPADNIYFANGNGIKYGTPDGSNPSSVILNSDRVTITPALNVNGGATFSNRAVVSNGGIGITGDSTITGNLTVNGSGKGIIYALGEIYEGGTAQENRLVNKYSKKLKTESFNDKTGSIDPQTSCGHKYVNIAQSGWTPLGIVGYNINYNGTNSSDPRYANLWECSLYSKNTNQIQYCIFNTASGNRKIDVNISFTVLYVKN